MSKKIKMISENTLNNIVLEMDYKGKTQVNGGECSLNGYMYKGIYKQGVKFENKFFKAFMEQLLQDHVDLYKELYLKLNNNGICYANGIFKCYYSKEDTLRYKDLKAIIKKIMFIIIHRIVTVYSNFCIEKSLTINLDTIKL